MRAHTHELANLTFTPMPFAAEPYFTSRDTAPNVAAAKVRCAVLCCAFLPPHETFCIVV